MSASTEFAVSLPFLGYKQRNAALDNCLLRHQAALARGAGEAHAARRSRGQHHRRAAAQLGPRDPPLQQRAPLHDQGGANIRAIAVAGVGSLRSAPLRLPASCGRARYRRRRHCHRLWAVGDDERGARRLVRLRRRRPDQTDHGARLRAHAPGRARRERHAAKRCRGDAGGDPARAPPKLDTLRPQQGRAGLRPSASALCRRSRGRRQPALQAPAYRHARRRGRGAGRVQDVKQYLGAL